MSWLLDLIFAWLLILFIKKIISLPSKPQIRKIAYRLTPDENKALALAHPMAHSKLNGCFAESPLPKINAELEQLLRPQLLHVFGLPTNLTDEAICSTLPEKLEHYWYRIDLNALQTDDDPLALMAFACARVAFSVRTAAMMGWVSPEQQWRILQLNRERASQCFKSWRDYGIAWSRGRKLWVEQARSDSFGVAFSEDDVTKWLTDPQHPWRQYSWP